MTAERERQSFKMQWKETGAFFDAASERIFEESGKGILASL